MKIHTLRTFTELTSSQYGDVQHRKSQKDVDILDLEKGFQPRVKQLPISLLSNPELFCNLKIIKCRYQQIYYIPNIPSLEELYCDHCKIEDIASMENLRILHCSNNKLSQIRSFPNLEILYCNDNHIEVVDNSPKLIYVNVHYNYLSLIDKLYFKFLNIFNVIFI